MRKATSIKLGYMSAVAVLLILGAGNVAYAQANGKPRAAPDSPFRMIPKESWLDPALRRFANRPLGGIADGIYPYPRKEGLTRYEAAVIVARAFERLDKGKVGISDVQRAMRHEQLSYDTEDLVTLRNLVTELATELKLLGCDVAQLQQMLTPMDLAAQVASGTSPLSDPPPGHWAYSSVERLRETGIFTGYPDGSLIDIANE